MKKVLFLVGVLYLGCMPAGCREGGALEYSRDVGEAAGIVSISEHRVVRNGKEEVMIVVVPKGAGNAAVWISG